MIRGVLARDRGLPPVLASSKLAGLTLAELMIAAFAGVGWDLPLLYLASDETITRVSGLASFWLNEGTAGPAYNATQANDARRPTYEAAGLNGGPCLFFGASGGRSMAVPAFDASVYDAMALMIIFQDTRTTLGRPVAFGDTNVGNNGSLGVITNFFFSGADGFLGCFAAFFRAVSTASYPMTDPDVVTATVDYALAGTGNRRRIRHGGIDVTASLAEGDGPTACGNHILTIGSPTSFLGRIAMVGLAAGPSTGSPLGPTAALAEAEALAAANWGL